jgi:hypothetical protein
LDSVVGSHGGTPAPQDPATLSTRELVLIGQGAGHSMVSEDKAVCVGVEAGALFNDWSNNVAVGYKATALPTADGSNVCVGSTAGGLGGLCNRNIAIGNRALSKVASQDTITIGYNITNNDDNTCSKFVWHWGGGQRARRYQTFVSVQTAFVISVLCLIDSRIKFCI